MLKVLHRIINVRGRAVLKWYPWLYEYCMKLYLNESKYPFSSLKHQVCAGKGSKCVSDQQLLTQQAQMVLIWSLVHC